MLYWAISVFLALLAWVYGTEDIAWPGYDCSRLPAPIQGYHPDMTARWVNLKRNLQVGDSIIVRGRLGPGVLPRKRWFFDLPVGDSRVYLQAQSTFHFSCQYDIGLLYFGRWDGGNWVDWFVAPNPFNAGPFNFRVDVQSDGYSVSKDGVFLGKYKSNTYSSVNSVYVENFIFEDDNCCDQEPVCDNLQGNQLSVIIADSRVQQIRGSCPSANTW
ncbi:unnamed protein product [Caenorhabditis auriculariae]|uniref:Galectin domain-containing protein n=1 Tax=Caenorhabditis auriculariae TaxID=2777116 RepID=A0A8S1H5I3_9PELO|nr:unnamed protein product [Caenorhabditis auriculariae]